MKNTKEDNALLAGFMEIPKNLHLYECPYSGMYVDAEELPYHLSWDIIIPVVKEAIERSKKYGSEIYIDWVEVFNSALISLNINTVYRACLDFVRFHNKKCKEESTDGNAVVVNVSQIKVN